MGTSELYGGCAYYGGMDLPLHLLHLILWPTIILSHHNLVIVTSLDPCHF